MYRGHDRNKRYTYVCKKGRGHLVRDMAALDNYVTTIVLEVLADPDLLSRLHADSEDPLLTSALARAAAMRQRIADATVEFTAGRLSASTLAAVEGSLLPLIAAAEREARRAVVPQVVLDAAGPDAAAWWDAADIVKRRAIVSELLTITVLPAPPGRRGFDAAYVTVDKRLG
jgi:hypothetical protein